MAGTRAGAGRISYVCRSGGWSAVRDRVLLDARRGTVFGASGRGFGAARTRDRCGAAAGDPGIAGEADPRDREAGRREDAAAAAVLRARGLDACAVWLRCAGLSGGDGRLRLAADERGRDEQAGI